MTMVTTEPQAEYRTEPHRWQTSLPARVLRRIGRHWVLWRHVRRFCRPFEVEGREALADARNPVIIMVNHTSHMDTLAALAVLPERLRSRVAIAAAADRFYLPTKRGWWYSLFYNAFPLERHRHGGSATLAYPLSLLQRGWSVLIYPEGTRSVTGELGAFHHGVAYLAMQANVPVVPIFTWGLRDVMPKGQRTPRPAAVRARIGSPVWLDECDSVPAGTARLEASMRALGGLPARAAEEAAAAELAPAR